MPIFKNTFLQKPAPRCIMGINEKNDKGSSPTYGLEFLGHVFGHLGILSKFWPHCIFLLSQLAKLPQNLQEILSKISLRHDS